MTTPTLQELLQQQAALKQQIEQLRASERKGTIKAIRALIDQYQLTPEDLFSAKKKRGTSVETARRPPKYRHPETGQTWSGYGRVPSWMKGKHDDDFAIPTSD